ncbi:hydrogenase expression/formation protein HypE [Edaphobacter sp. DSM 109919]|uniref:Hydrogenase expression/formation protein HypE n=1 Tax=Edaphobacter paludis TaxID=3035702 RepID=A0AAU7CZW6_9BACT
MKPDGNVSKTGVDLDLNGEENSAASLLSASCPLPVFDHNNIVLGHGSGGKLTADLIDKIFLPAFRNPTLDKLDDQAVVTIGNTRLAFATDSFVVTPIFFPGGDIGRLAIHGTVNDLAMSGARPLYLSAAFILEEGLAVDDLRRVVESMRTAAAEAGVELVTGDTKVVNRGKGDQIFITTTGIGIIEHDSNISADRAHPRDKIILSGYIGDHGMTIMSQREGLEFESAIESDCASLNDLVATMLATTSSAKDFIHTLRDPTRGGVATTLNEIAKHANVGMLLDERTIPVRESVKGACEVLGLDPLYVANEGKLLALVVPEMADAVLEQMRQHRLGQDAVIIGEVVEAHPGMVLMKTEIGGTRVLDVMFGEQLPRIC